MRVFAKAAGVRLLHMSAVLLVVAFGVSLMLDLSPGDPAVTMLGDQASQEQVDQLHRQLGLDDPFYSRFVHWVSGVLSGDFGTSYFSHRRVLSTLLTAAPVTAELILLSVACALVLALPIGMLTAQRQGGVADRAWLLVSSAMIACPPFVSALLLVFVFSIKAQGLAIQLPATGWSPLQDGIASNLEYLLLPVATLTAVLLPSYSRVLRNDLLATLGEDFVLVARSKGLGSRSVLVRHVLKPSSLPLVTVAGLSIGQLLGGAVVVEVLFAMPGLGQQIVNAILVKDLPVVQGGVMFIAIAYVLINAAVDGTYRLLDPRLRARPTR